MRISVTVLFAIGIYKGSNLLRIGSSGRNMGLHKSRTELPSMELVNNRNFRISS